jgi:HlyD family secretion protein
VLKNIVLIVSGFLILIFIFYFLNPTTLLISDNIVMPRKGKIENVILIDGEILPSKEIDVKSSISGILEHFFVSVNQDVNQGDNLVKIKMNPTPTQLENAQYNLNAAKIEYELLSCHSLNVG